MVAYLAHFVSKPDVDQFRLDELIALADLAGVDVLSVAARERLLLGSSRVACHSFDAATWTAFVDVHDAFVSGSCPFLYVWLAHDEQAAALVSRGVLVRAVFRLVCPHRTTIESLASSVLAVHNDTRPIPGFSALAPVLSAAVFRYDVESYERKITMDDKNAAIRNFFPLPHTGRKDLYSEDATRVCIFLLHDRPTKALRFAFYAAQVSTSQRSHFMDHYALNTRRYIGTTTMPPELTFLMSNLGRVRRGALVVDPFVGTGATLISAAHFGATTMGFDMDGRVLRDGAIVGSQALQDLELREAERNKKAARAAGPAALAVSSATVAAEADGHPAANPAKRSMPVPSFRQNFADYRLPAADAFRLNFSVAHSFFAAALSRRSNQGFIDAIISDPPYGIREQQRKVVGPSPPTTGGGGDGSPAVGRLPLAKYHTGDLMLDLVCFAGRALVVGGYLVYWHPTNRATYTDAEIPQHPAMRVVMNVEQGLSIKIGRRLVVLQKVSHVDDSLLDMASIQAAMKAPDNVRNVTHDVGSGPDSYKAYKEKRAAIRDSHLQWREEQGLSGVRSTRAERREINMVNRLKKVVEKDHKETVFHVRKDKAATVVEGQDLPAAGVDAHEPSAAAGSASAAHDVAGDEKQEPTPQPSSAA